MLDSRTQDSVLALARREPDWFLGLCRLQPLDLHQEETDLVDMLNELDRLLCAGESLECDETRLNETDVSNGERQGLTKVHQTNTHLVRRIQRRFKRANLSHKALCEALGGSCFCNLGEYLCVALEFLE